MVSSISEGKCNYCIEFQLRFSGQTHKRIELYASTEVRAFESILYMLENLEMEENYDHNPYYKDVEAVYKDRLPHLCEMLKTPFSKYDEHGDERNQDHLFPSEWLWILISNNPNPKTVEAHSKRIVQDIIPYMDLGSWCYPLHSPIHWTIRRLKDETVVEKNSLITGSLKPVKCEMNSKTFYK